MKMMEGDGHSNQNKTTYIIKLEHFILNEYILHSMNLIYIYDHNL